MIEFKKFDETKEYLILNFFIKINRDIKISDIGFKFETNKLIIYFDKFLNKNFNYVWEEMNGSLENKDYKIKKLGKTFMFTFKKKDKGKWISLLKEKSLKYTKLNESLINLKIDNYLQNSISFNNKSNKGDESNHIKNNENLNKNNLKLTETTSSNLKSKIDFELKIKNFNKHNTKKQKIKTRKNNSLKKEIKTSSKKNLKKNNIINYNNKKENNLLDNDSLNKKNSIVLKKYSINKINNNKNFIFNSIDDNLNKKNKLKLIDNNVFFNKENQKINEDENNFIKNKKENLLFEINNEIGSLININYYKDKINKENKINDNLEIIDNNNNILIIKDILKFQDNLISNLKNKLIKEKKGRLKTEEQIGKILNKIKN